MDKNSIKKYAVWARRELLSRVSQKAEQYGICEDVEADPAQDTVDGHLLSPMEKRQRQALIARVKKLGYRGTMDEAAYTWFNRFSALRFMEVNGYLPSHVRVFTDENGAFKPQILTEAISLELDGLDMERVYALKEADKTEELYKYLLITQCNALSEILPGMFTPIEDYTALLFPDNLLREGSVAERMVAMIPEEDWQDAVQIIGWLYQYYNTEPKDKVFADLKKNIKISKENIPAATQLFTPDWIVRYMVENSLGRLWVEGHPDDELKAGWKYYLEEAEQEPEVQAQLAEIRKEYAALRPEDIRVIDPCMGSGHILVYMFDVLVQIYCAYGYSARDAAQMILRNNLYGLDIDDRASQLAYFAVMMKARQYDRKIFSRGIRPHVHAIVESNGIRRDVLDYFENGDPALKAAMESIVKELHDAKEYGSILNITPVDFAALYARVDAITDEMSVYTKIVLEEVYPLIEVAEAMAQNYNTVITNPPYMSAANMTSKLTNFVRINYPDSKSDLFSVFIQKCKRMTKENYLQAMITQHVWMFIPTFEALRNELCNTDMVNMVHLGPRAFEEIGGEVVQTASFVMRKSNLGRYKGAYIKLNGYPSQDEKERAFLYYQAQLRYDIDNEKFTHVPGTPFIYWMTPNVLAAFSNKRIGEALEPKTGVTTGNNDIFLRLWHEVSFEQIDSKWFPLNKGGSYRKWYGNNEYVIDWEHDGKRIKDFDGSTVRNEQYYFRPGVTWSKICSGNLSGRFSPQRHMFDAVGLTCFASTSEELNYLLAFMCSSVATMFVKMLNPTLSYTVGTISDLPWIFDACASTQMQNAVAENVSFAQVDWDSFETSWDFKMHPLVRWSKGLWDLTETSATYNHFYPGQKPDFSRPLELCYKLWAGECEERFNKLKANEEELNRIFIDIYGLQDELTPEVEDKDVTVRKADLGRDIRSLISYAVGCMFGRYSLDKEGLVLAGYSKVVEHIEVITDDDDPRLDKFTVRNEDGSYSSKTRYCEVNQDNFKSFPIDADNIIPICDDDYFDDDITGRFIQWVETVYGKDSLEENLAFIAHALGGRGTPREVIRAYFLNDFYKDHLKTYQKRPIYWLFDSGKKNGFKALIYMHRYRPDTIARIRTDFVHEQQSRYRTAIADLTLRIRSAASTADRVKLTRRLQTIQSQADELHAYEEKIHHLADMMIPIDLDDGVKHNYELFADVLAKIK